MKKLLAMVAATALLAGCAGGSESSLEDKKKRTDAMFEQVLRTDAPGCSAAVAVKGEIVWAGARGLADAAASTPLTEQTIFDIASVSKQFTGAAIVMLERDGSLSRSDALSTFVSGLPLWADDVTIDELLHHSSGIPDYVGLLNDSGTAIDEPASQADAVAAIAQVPELEGKGRFAYSNSNYILLAEIVAAASGTTLADYLQTEVFAPLDLDMRLEPALAGPEVALSYSGGKIAESAWTQVGDGSIYTTPSELARWGDALRTGIDGFELAEALAQEPISTGAPDGSKYGAGLVVAEDGALSHLGGWAGFVTTFGVSADRSTSIALSCNSVDAAADDLAKGLLNIWNPR